MPGNHGKDEKGRPQLHRGTQGDHDATRGRVTAVPESCQPHANGGHHVEAIPHDGSEEWHQDDPPQSAGSVAVDPHGDSKQCVKQQHRRGECRYEVGVTGRPVQGTQEPHDRKRVFRKNHWIGLSALHPPQVVLHIPGDVVRRGFDEDMEHSHASGNPQHDGAGPGKQGGS